MSLPTPYYQDDAVSVINGEALEIMRGMESDTFNAIITDPPYFKVKDEDWDNQWKTPAEFLAWMGELCAEWKRLLKPNGSLFVFASPEMASRVEVKIGESFNVLNRIAWRKPPFSTKAEMFVKEDLRCFFPASEAIIFAEHFGADFGAKEEAGYDAACEQTKRGVFGEYLADAFDKAEATRKEIAGLFPSRTGGLTGCVSNWVLGLNCPTKEQYLKMREHLNRNGGEHLTREYEDLRREYEDLRRPFTVTAKVPYTDVWDFSTVGTYNGKHPCEKPIELMKHIVSSATRSGDKILDCFSGSGATAKAAKALGRFCVAIEKDERWCQDSAMAMCQEVLI